MIDIEHTAGASRRRADNNAPHPRPRGRRRERPPGPPLRRGRMLLPRAKNGRRLVQVSVAGRTQKEGPNLLEQRVVPPSKQRHRYYGLPRAARARRVAVFRMSRQRVGSEGQADDRGDCRSRTRSRRCLWGRSGWRTTSPRFIKCEFPSSSFGLLASSRPRVHAVAATRLANKDHS